MSDKFTPYVLTRGRAKPFDWNAFLANPCQKMDCGELLHASTLAGSWVTCACGNQCAVLPRNENAAPQDGTLYELGKSFSSLIDRLQEKCLQGDCEAGERYRERAQECLEHIELRSAELLMELAKKSL